MEAYEVYYGENFSLDLEYFYTVGGYVTFRAAVSADGFCGAHAFCVRQTDLYEMIRALEGLENWQATLIDGESASCLQVTGCGERVRFGGVLEEPFVSLRFSEAETDRTVVPRLIAALREFADREELHAGI